MWLTLQVLKAVAKVSDRIYIDEELLKHWGEWQVKWTPIRCIRVIHPKAPTTVSKMCNVVVSAPRRRPSILQGPHRCCSARDCINILLCMQVPKAMVLCTCTQACNIEAASLHSSNCYIAYYSLQILILRLQDEHSAKLVYWLALSTEKFNKVWQARSVLTFSLPTGAVLTGWRRSTRCLWWRCNLPCGQCWQKAAWECTADQHSQPWWRLTLLLALQCTERCLWVSASLWASCIPKLRAQSRLCAEIG